MTCLTGYTLTGTSTSCSSAGVYTAQTCATQTYSSARWSTSGGNYVNSLLLIHSAIYTVLFTPRYYQPVECVEHPHYSSSEYLVLRYYFRSLGCLLRSTISVSICNIELSKYNNSHSSYSVHSIIWYRKYLVPLYFRPKRPHCLCY